MSFDRWQRAAGGVLLALLPLLSGCYEFDKPLGPPEKGTIDRALVGAWRCETEPKGLAEKDGKQESLLRIFPFDATQYVVQMEAKENGVTECAPFRLYSSRVGTHVLLNAQEVKPEPKGWSLVRYRVEGPTLTMWIIDDKTVGDSGEAGLRAVRKRVADESIYEKLFNCTREEEKK